MASSRRHPSRRVTRSVADEEHPCPVDRLPDDGGRSHRRGHDLVGARRRRDLHRPGRRRTPLRRHLHELRRRADRRERRLPAGAGERSRRELPDRRLLPRLGRLEDRPHRRRGAGVPRRRLRGLLDERSRLGQLVRRDRSEAPHAGRLRQRLQPLDGHALRGAGRAGGVRGARRSARRRRARRRRFDRSAEDRVDGRIVRRRPVDGARRAQEPPDAAGRLARAVGQRRRQGAADRRGAARHPVDRPRLRADAERPHARLRRPTRPTSRAAGSAS